MNLDEVDAFATALPDVVVGHKWGRRTWMIGDKGFAWQRPMSKADLKRFGDAPPPVGDILAVHVENLDAKDALLAIAPRGFFTIPHFNGYPAVLIELRLARAADVRAAVRAAWRTLADQPQKPARARKKPAARRSRGAAPRSKRTRATRSREQ